MASESKNDPLRHQRVDAINRTGMRQESGFKDETRYTPLGDVDEVVCRPNRGISGRKGVGDSDWRCEYSGRGGRGEFGVDDLDVEANGTRTDGEAVYVEPDGKCAIKRPHFDHPGERVLVCPSDPDVRDRTKRY